MKKLLLVLLVPLLMGGVGFAVGRYLLPTGQETVATAEAETGKAKTLLYKMPLGKFTFQVLQPARILHIVVDIDIYLSDVTAYETFGSKGGKARLRDATISAVSDLSETILWVGEGEEHDLDKTALAEKIVLKLHTSFPAVNSAQLNQFFVSSTPRQ